MAGAPPPALRFREERSAWTILEVVSHMADAEIVDWLNDQKDEGGFNDFGLPNMPTPRDALARGPLRDFLRLRRSTWRCECG